jgi:nucleotide-binding universal stress UspA family protein
MSDTLRARGDGPAARPDEAIRRVLVATDFSANSGIAVEWAVELARANRATITLFHALDPRQVGRSTDDHDETKRNLDNAAKAVRELQPSAVVEHELGKPWEAIVSAAARHHADLVVIGASGHGTLGKKLLGGTADRVIRTSTVPVLVIHPSDAAPTRGIRRALAPIDFSEASLQAARTALRLFHGEMTSTLVLLHVCELTVPATGTGFAPAAIDPDFWSNCEREAKAQLEQFAATLRRDDVRVETVATRGFPSMAIIEQAGGLGVDLIAMGTHGRGGLNRILLGSIAERVLQDSPCAVLVVREAAAPVDSASR